MGLNEDIEKKKTVKKGVIIAVAAAAAIAVAAVCMIKAAPGGKERANTLSLVKMYMDKGQYDHAMDLLDGLLVKNAQDKDALDLMDKVIALKGDGKAPSQAATAPDVNVSIDTSDLKAMRSSLDSMKNELARNSAEAAKEQEAQAERIAQEKAADEKRAKEEAARKAAEAELAKKNKALQKEIETVNDEVTQARAALAAHDAAGALKHFTKMEGMLPVSDGEPGFSAGKYAEAASLLYDAAGKASDADEKKKLESAAENYAKAAVAKKPSDAPSHYILGMAALDRGDKQAALDELAKAVAYDGTNHLYFYNLGKVQYMLKKYSEARASFQSCTGLRNDFAPAQYNLGLACLRTGRDKDALDAFRKARDTDPHYEKAYLEEARLLVKRGDLQGAASAYTNVIKINNINGDAQRELGAVYYALGNYQASEDCYKKALALLSPDQADPATYYNLSTTLFAEDKASDAVAYARKAYDQKDALSDKNARANVVYNYALMLEKTGKSDDSIPVYSEVLKINPDHDKTLINLGVMYMNMTPPEIDTALQLFLKAYAQDKNSFEANNNLGSAYLKKQDYKNAVLYFQNALKIEPKNTTVLSNLAQTFAGDSQLDNAKTTYLELIRQDPKNMDAYIELAKVCMSLKDNVSAEKYLLYAQSKQPDYRKAEVDQMLGAIK